MDKREVLLWDLVLRHSRKKMNHPLLTSPYDTPEYRKEGRLDPGEAILVKVPEVFTTKPPQSPHKKPRAWGLSGRASGK